MGEVTVRDLRKHGERVLDRVAAGERVIITRGGRPVARLEPVPRGRQTASALVERFRRLPAVDPDRRHCWSIDLRKAGVTNRLVVRRAYRRPEKPR